MARTLVIKSVKAGGRTFAVSKKLLIAPTLKKFMVHFRRPSGYQGKYGFDWLRDEYIYPITPVTHDNSGNPITPINYDATGKIIGTPTALCKNISALKTEYKTTDVKNPISPYGKDYYPAWLSIFPHTTTAGFKHGSDLNHKGVPLNLEIETLEALVDDATEIIFECNNKNIDINPKKIFLKTIVSTQKLTKSLGGTSKREYYKATTKIKIKNGKDKNKTKPLKNHEEIKVFAKLGTQKEEVGKLMLYKNDVIPKANIVVVNVITHATSVKLRDDYQYLFKRQSFNQALIRAEVDVDTKFDLTKLKMNADVSTFLNNFNTMNSEQIMISIRTLYEKYGKHKPNIGKIDDNTNTRTYLFYTDISAGRTNGRCSLDNVTNIWGNHYIIFNNGLNSKRTVIHECGHSLSLPHIFSSRLSPFKFYHGYTDNYMDYEWQMGGIVNGKKTSSRANKFKGSMYSLYKWQWRILRTDRSLITNY